jgi:hypothetical protein
LEQKKRPKLTDAERYQRFLDVAKKVGASRERKDFEEALMKIAGHSSSRPEKTRPPGRKDPQESGE